MSCAEYEVVIIGNGAAGLAVADRLAEKGIWNICIVTENRTLSTSRCSGSDKQTYYKLDIASPEGDSVRKMAEDMFAGGSMNGSDAYMESALSLPCFMHLCELGVPFPKDEYGVYQGYRTDHDNTKRATSCGPLTSKYMTERLEAKVAADGTAILDGHKVVKLAVSNGKCFGVYCLAGGKIRFIPAKYTVLCTGAPCGIYSESVYPEGLSGATGLAAEAGATLQNFQEWQYGIASIGFRWNLSGSYQQVIPRYVSVSPDGEEREFLADIGSPFDKIFLKGYEWPFNSAKTEGSSLVDMMILSEKAKGNRVFVDYTRNPTGFSFGKLGEEASGYLEKAGVDGATPYERLTQLNPKAAALFLDHGTDLSAEMLECAVCAQHNNGGVRVDGNGETTVKNLFCSGEASGRFGVCRPGGAALNDTQAGAVRIASYIAAAETEYSSGECEPPVLPALSDESNVADIDRYFASEMSEIAGAVRDTDEIGLLVPSLENLAADFSSFVRISSPQEYAAYFTLYHNTLARLALCVTELSAAEKCGSRGGCIYLKNGGMIPLRADSLKSVTVTDGKTVRYEPADGIPVYESVFERLLRNDG